MELVDQLGKLYPLTIPDLRGQGNQSFVLTVTFLHTPLSRNVVHRLLHWSTAG
jgi:hypothetical protein